MRIPPSATRSTARVTLTVVTAWYLTVQTASHIAWDIPDAWSRYHADTPLIAMLGKFGKIVRYHLDSAVNPRTFFAIDGDHRGRRRADLDRSQARQRRALADLRRRHARMLLCALGTTADEVEATLTRHWQRTNMDGWMTPLIPHFLATRLRWRDWPVYHEIDIHPWASNISGVWVATPAPVRRYLSRSYEHEMRLSQGYTRHPRRGVRQIPSPQSA